MSTTHVTRDEFATKLWTVETKRKLYEWGDHGLAMGPYQEHPDWVWTWAHTLNCPPLQNQSWAHWEGRLVRAFYDRTREVFPFFDDTEIAMYFHLGHVSHRDHGDWDEIYAAEFEAAPGTIEQA